MQYRKFMAHTPIGTSAKNYPGLYLVNQSDLVNFDLLTIHSAVVTPYLLPQPLQINNLYLQYAACHGISDLLRYTALAIDLNVISSSESHDFLNSTHMIPGGIEFGIYPVVVFMNLIKKIQTVSMAFLKTHNPSVLKTNQRRAVSFCNERLGSFLLTKHLQHEFNNKIPNELFGYMHAVTEDCIYKESPR